MSSSCTWYKLFEIWRLIFHIGNPKVGLALLQKLIVVENLTNLGMEPVIQSDIHLHYSDSLHVFTRSWGLPSWPVTDSCTASGTISTRKLCPQPGAPRGLWGPRANTKSGPIIKIVWGGSGGTPPGNFEILHALKCVLEASEAPFQACIQYIRICKLSSSFSGFRSKSSTLALVSSSAEITSDELCIFEVCVSSVSAKQKSTLTWNQQYSRPTLIRIPLYQ